MSVATDLATATETFGAAYAAALAANPKFENQWAIRLAIKRRLATLGAKDFSNSTGRVGLLGPAASAGELVSELSRLVP